MGSLRTPETEERYRNEIEKGGLEKCALCTKESLHEFTHWRTLKNDFPYDRFAQRHDMIVPIRHVTGAELSSEELAELEVIKKEYIDPNYEWVMEATHRKKSIPGHFHLHLIVTKP